MKNYKYINWRNSIQINSQEIHIVNTIKNEEKCKENKLKYSSKF